MVIFDYEVIKTVYETSESIIYKAVNISDKAAVIIKILNHEYPSEEQIAQFKYEYEIIKDINIHGVIKAHHLIDYKSSLAIIFEDFGGESINNFNFKTWELKAKLELFNKIIDILDKIHAKEMIHKDINPSNILLNTHTKEVKFIDFANATKLTKEKSIINSNIIMEGNLAYISPEQTGRMNRVVDYRSDYYSLGATFYEILAGQKIFSDISDPVELMHYHLAKEPKPLHILDQKIPIPISKIVMKLLAKNAEDRYQSTLGIKSDIQYCIDQLHEKNKIENFVLASKDKLSRFQIPQKLYGRKAELADLIAAYDNVCMGSFELMLVTGSSGIGKSVLVNEVQKLAFHKKGYFVSGKFDKYSKNVPYSAVMYAFRELIRLILSENDEKIEGIKEKLRGNLGTNGRIILDVIPEAKSLMGEQPPVEELPPIENQNRFNFLFNEFVRSFICPKNPIVLFFDDLQWADNASLDLLKSLSITKDNGYLFIICSYRDDEIEELQPIETCLTELRNHYVAIKTLKLHPLRLQDVKKLVTDTLRSNFARTDELSTYIYKKTLGIPFFIKEMLEQLHEKNLVYFDNQNLCWTWNLKKITQACFLSNVDMLVQRMKSRDENLQRVLKLASLVANSFDYNTLLAFDEAKQAETASGLWNALQEGFILPLDSSYKYIKNANVNCRFKFFHDRIQQAAYSLIEHNDKKCLHLQIGRIIKVNIHENDMEDRIFDIVTHLNLGREFISDEKEIKELAKLNYMAGTKAKRSSAFVSALQHFHLAIEQFGSEIWLYDHNMALTLFTQAAETAYSCAEYHTMDNYISMVMENSNNVLDRIKIYEIKILSLLAKNNAREAVEIALQALKQLGVTFPKNVSKGYILYKLMLFKIFRYEKNIERLSTLSSIKNKEKAAVMRLLATVSSSAYLTAPELFVLMVLKQIEVSIKYGKSIQTPFAYCTYGVILCGLLGDIDSGYKFAKTGLEMMGKSDNKELVGKTMVVACIFVTHWKEKPDEVLELLSRGYTLSIESGDVEYAAWALLCHGFHSFFAGKNIKNLNSELTVSSEKIISVFGQAKQFNSLCTFQQLIKKLCNNENGNKTVLSDENYDENKMLELCHENNDRNVAYYIYSNKMILNLFFGNYDLAVKSAELAEIYIDSVLSTINYPVFFFYSTLAYLAVYDNLDQKHKGKIHKNLKKIKKWTESSPHSYKYRYYLLQAEIYRIENVYEKAAAYFDLAIDDAVRNGVMQDAALSNELASKFYKHRGKENIAKAYMLEAYILYQKWGADEKIRELEGKYFYLKKSRRYSRKAAHVFDTSSIIKISQLLASEMKYENLIKKMMRIVMENAGAQRGLFFIREHNELFVEAEASLDGERGEIVNRKHVDKYKDAFAETIVNYVWRTEDSVVIHDAVKDILFLNDSYIKKCRPKSILCIPVLTQNKLVGILYFENNLIKGAFVEDRIEILKIVASQAAISLENINLYRHLEEKVIERTTQLKERSSELENAYEELKLALDNLQIARVDRLNLVGQMAASIGHEVRNPMTTVRGYLQHYSGKPDFLKYKEQFALMIDELDRANSIITEFLSLAKNNEVALAACNLNDIINNIFPLLEAEGLERKKNICKNLQTVPDILMNDGNIRQVIHNLVRNGMEAGDNVEIQTYLEEDKIMLSIKDDGPGIPQAVLSKLGLPFITTKENGTGLGLAVCYNIVEKHHATIQVKSTPQGTTFYVCFQINSV